MSGDAAAVDRVRHGLSRRNGIVQMDDVAETLRYIDRLLEERRRWVKRAGEYLKRAQEAEAKLKES